jgi:hypothetical protein
MAGHRDCDGGGHSSDVAAHHDHAQVDCLCPPPVSGILWIHHMEDGGLIHVDGEGGRLIPVVDGGNNLLEVPVGLIAHFLGGALHSVRGHAVDKAIFCHKARNGCFLRRESLVGESRIQLAGLSDEA